MSPRRVLVSFMVLSLVSSPSASAAEDAPSLTVAPLLGAWLPVGAAHQDFSTAPLLGIRAAYELSPAIATVATFSWIPTEAKVLGATQLDLFQYDLGFQAQHALPVGAGGTLRPFLGAGGGLRTVHFREGQLAGGTDLGAYASAGFDLGFRAVTAGLTVRYELLRMNASGLDSFYRTLELCGSLTARF